MKTKYVNKWTYKVSDWKRKVKSWYVWYQRRESKKRMANSVEGLKAWSAVHASPVPGVSTPSTDEHEVFSITPKGQAYRNKDQGLHIVLTSRHLIKRLTLYKTLCVDATYKLSANGLLLMVLGVIDKWGRFHACAFCITKRETNIEYSKLFKECHDFVLAHFGCPLTPHAIVHDNANGIYLVVEEAVEHWGTLVKSDLLNDINCAVHLDSGHTNAKGREKFDGWAGTNLSKMNVRQIKAKLKELGLEVKGKQIDLIARLQEAIPDEVCTSEAPQTGGLYDLYHKDFIRDVHKIGWEVQRGSQLPAAFKLFCDRWEPLLPRLMANFKKEYWGKRKGWWPRCLNELNNNNPLENFNKIIKEWRDHVALLWSLLLDFLLEDIGAYSREDSTIPDPLNHFDMPTDDVYTRKRIRKLWIAVCTQAEAILARSHPSSFDSDCTLVLNPSYSHVITTQEQRKHFEFIYVQSQAIEGENFDQFVARRTCFYQVRVNKRDHFKTSCSCPYYMQYKTCKHALVHAIANGASLPVGCDFRHVVDSKRKAGRPKKARPALERDPTQVPIISAAPCDLDEYHEVVQADNEAKALLGIPTPGPSASNRVALSSSHALSRAHLLGTTALTVCQEPLAKRQKLQYAQQEVLRLQSLLQEQILKLSQIS
jgi:hypothetical protein